MAQNDGDLNIRINTTSDPKGVVDTKKQLDEVKKSAEEAAPSIHKVVDEIKKTGDPKGLKETKKQLGEVKAEAKSLTEHYRAAGGGLRGVFAAISGGAPGAAAAVTLVTTAVLAAKKALVEFALAETSVRRLQAALAQNGHLTEEVNKQYQDLASTLQDLTGKADDEWIDVLRRLTQSGATPGEMERHVAAVKNLAGIMGGDLTSAAAAVAKAMEGEFHAFTRLGIEIDQNATKSEKLDLLYRELAQRGGGQLEATTLGLTGHFDKLKNSVSDLFEAIGQRISDTGALQYVLYGLGTTIGWVAEKMGHTIGVSDGLRNGLRKTNETVRDAERFNRQYGESLKESQQYSDAMAASLERQIEAHRKLKQIRDEEADAQMALDLAIVDRLEKTGKISEEDAIRRRSGIRTRAAGAKHQREQDLRSEEALHKQRQIDRLMLQIGEENTEAERAESEVQSEAEANGKIATLLDKKNREVAHWKVQLAELNRLGGAYRNPEVGATDEAFANTPAGGNFSEDIRFEIESRMRLEEARFRAQEKKLMRGVSGSQERARSARERANKTVSQAYPQIDQYTSEIDAITSDAQVADSLFRKRMMTQAVQTGTEALGANPSVNTRGIESAVLQNSGAFEGILTNIGDLIQRGEERKERALKALEQRVRNMELREKNNLP